MTWRELVYMITDITKQISDDSQFNEDHIIFLCSKYRNYILNQQYLSGKKTINEANYQTICIDVEPQITDICPNEEVLVSVEKVPFTMTIGSRNVYPAGMFESRSKLSYVDIFRFPYVGNKFSKTMIYTTIAPDNHLYIKSENKNFIYMKKVSFKAIFEDIVYASILEEKCRTGCLECDVMDTRFPLEDAWVNSLINLVVNDLTRGINMLRDNQNDATDDSDQLARQISLYTNNAFKRLMRGNQDNNNEQS